MLHIPLLCSTSKSQGAWPATGNYLACTGVDPKLSFLQYIICLVLTELCANGSKVNKKNKDRRARTIGGPRQRSSMTSDNVQRQQSQGMQAMNIDKQKHTGGEHLSSLAYMRMVL